MYNSIKAIIFTMLATPVFSELAPLAEDDLTQVSGQAGITISARAELASGTRVSFSNENIQADHYDANGNYISAGKPPANWLVVDDITGAIEFRDMDIDVISGIGPNSDKTALQVTLPDLVDVKSLKTRGLYLGGKPTVGYKEITQPDGAKVQKSDTHLFILGLELDGRLSMPADTKVNIFPVDQ